MGEAHTPGMEYRVASSSPLLSIFILSYGPLFYTLGAPPPLSALPAFCFFSLCALDPCASDSFAAPHQQRQNETNTQHETINNVIARHDPQNMQARFNRPGTRHMVHHSLQYDAGRHMTDIAYLIHVTHPPNNFFFRLSSCVCCRASWYMKQKLRPGNFTPTLSMQFGDSRTRLTLSMRNTVGRNLVDYSSSNSGSFYMFVDL